MLNPVMKMAFKRIVYYSIAAFGKNLKRRQALYGE
jgi:hypothetical protein